jgi:hypothetical protein
MREITTGPTSRKVHFTPPHGDGDSGKGTPVLLTLVVFQMHGLQLGAGQTMTKVHSMIKCKAQPLATSRRTRLRTLSRPRYMGEVNQ